MFMWLAGLAGALLMTAVLPVHSVELGPYAVILSRKPFGEPPPEPVTDAQPVAQPAGPSLADQYKMCAIKETEDGMWVGFVEAKTSKSYYMKVGEREDDIEVLDADYDLEKALLRKGSQESWITMGSRGAGTPGMPPGLMAPLPGEGTSTNRMSYAERRRRRLAELEERRRKIAEAPKLPQEELEKKLQEYQMELIRAGGEKGPPLPLPLTPEMDDQLVAEGVLAPNDGTEQPAPPAE